MTDIVVKNIKFDFEADSTYEAARFVAESTVADNYKEEQLYQKEEYESMLADGDVKNMEEYKEYLDLTPADVDYSLSFEANKSHPQIQREISDIASNYMKNIYDLPKTVVVALNESHLDSNGKPEHSAVIEALNKMLKEKSIGDSKVSVSSYEAAGKAERKDILTQQAYDSVTEMMNSKEYQSFLKLRASIQKYSHNNISLIYSQKPDAKAVMGYNAWQKLDRHVDKGQTGIAIWQPTSSQKKSEKAIDAHIEKLVQSDPVRYPSVDCKRAVDLKNKMMDELLTKGYAEVGMGYRLGTTFDISQTVPNDPENDNLEDIINLNKPLKEDLVNYDDVVKSMKDAAILAPLNISSVKSQQDALFDALNSYADTVLSKTPEKVQGIKSSEPLTGDMHTIETVMTAYMISEHIGIDCADKAGLKLAEIFNNKLSNQSITIGRRDMFMTAFDRSAKLYDMFTREFDKSFGYDIEQQREAVRKANEAKYNQKQEYKATHARFGRTTVAIADKWKSGKTEYVIGKDEETNLYFVRTVTGKKAEYLKDGDGNNAKFDDKPDRTDVEEYLKDQHKGIYLPPLDDNNAKGNGDIDR